MLADGCLLVSALADGHRCLWALLVSERYVLMLDDGRALCVWVLIGRKIFLLVGRRDLTLADSHGSKNQRSFPDGSSAELYRR